MNQDHDDPLSRVLEDMQKDPAEFGRQAARDLIKKETEDMKRMECIRCGLCCILGPCSRGEDIIDRAEPGCRYLVKDNNGNFACFLLMTKRIKPSEIHIGRGCMIRQHAIYQNLKKVCCYEHVANTVNWKRRCKELTRELNGTTSSRSPLSFLKKLLRIRHA